MSRIFSSGEALALLAEADSLLAQGAHRADVCRRLGISHVLYDRFLWKYRPDAARARLDRRPQLSAAHDFPPPQH